MRNAGTLPAFRKLMNHSSQLDQRAKYQLQLAMSHKPNVFSPPGTPLLERTVGELVAERPGRSRVFQAFQIDFCCQGGRTLHEACERKGIAAASVVEQLEAELADKSAPAQNPADLPADELAEYIFQKHHQFLWRELPRLHAMAERVAQVHGGHTPSLVEMFHIFCGMEEELTTHMRRGQWPVSIGANALHSSQDVARPCPRALCRCGSCSSRKRKPMTGKGTPRSTSSQFHLVPNRRRNCASCKSCG